MRFFKYLTTLLFVVLLTLGGVLPSIVSAQSQDDINPDFNASSDDTRAIFFNYDCSNLPWPSNAIDVYRRIDISEDPPVKTYYIYSGESIIDLEANPTKFNSDPARLVPYPRLVDVDGERKVMCSSKPGGCTSGIPSDECKPAQLIPPALQQIENYFIEGIYLFWAFLGTASTIALMRIGFEYLVSGFSPERLGAVNSKLAYWFAGLVLAILAIPGLQYIYGLINISTTRCFKYTDVEETTGEEKLVYDLTLPGFTFFFKDVCTGDYAVSNPGET